MCTDASWGFSEHYHPSSDNPLRTQAMDDEDRAQLTASQYDHEILAIFGTEEAGVFGKAKLDLAMKQEQYTYSPLTDTQRRNLEGNELPNMYIYEEGERAPSNVFRCVGVVYKFAPLYSNIQKNKIR